MTEPVQPVAGNQDWWSQGMLVAILMQNGGSMELPTTAITPETLTGPDGKLHGVKMDFIGPTLLRLSVVAAPEQGIS